MSNYLTLEAFRETLTATRRCAAPGSRFVLDYLLPEFLTGNAKQADGSPWLASVGEPLITGFTPEEFQREMQHLGWEVLEDLGPDDYGERYFRGRTDGFWPQGGKHIVCAGVLEEQRSEP